MTSPRSAPAVTAMWVWDNPVDPAADPRGRAYVPAATDRLVAFARAADLRDVALVAPTPLDDASAGGVVGTGLGPVDEWLRDTAAALRHAGVAVTAAVDAAAATPGWAAAVTALAPWDRLQVVVPWDRSPVGTSDVDSSDVDRLDVDSSDSPPSAGSGEGRAAVAALEAVRSAGTPVPLDVCVPWWFATEPGDDGRPLLHAVLARADRVALAAPAAHAQGPDGVLALAAPGVEALVAAGRRFTVAVRTDAPAGVGGGVRGGDGASGAARTFHAEGPVALLRESAIVARTLADVPGFDGVAVDSHRAWRRLLGV